MTKILSVTRTEKIAPSDIPDGEYEATIHRHIATFTIGDAVYNLGTIISGLGKKRGFVVSVDSGEVEIKETPLDDWHKEKRKQEEFRKKADDYEKYQELKARFEGD